MISQNARERYVRNVRRVAATTLDQVNTASEAYPELQYFSEMLKGIFIDFKPGKETFIGSYCVMIPDEIIYGFGCRPLRLCASHSTAALVGDDIVPRDACPVIKASVAFNYMKILPLYNQCSCAIVPMTCEGKHKSAELMASYLPIIPVPLKATKTNAGFESNVRYLKGMIRPLEQITGRKFSHNKMLKAYEEINYAQAQAYILASYLQMENPPLPGSVTMMVLNTFCYAEAKSWGAQVAKLNNSITTSLGKREERKNKKPRIFIAGSPISFPNYKVPFMLEELGAQIVGDESCLAGRLLYDPVVPRDKSLDSMIRALAARYISACTCPVFDDADDRQEGLFEKVRKAKAEGIIYHVLRGCNPYDFELPIIENIAREHDIPVLRIETDFSPEDTEQVKIRFEAFLEMIEQRRRVANGKVLSRV